MKNSLVIAESHLPDVTVVVPCYNAERWIGRAIDTALSQKHVSVEVIVVDDGSTDRSFEVIRSYGDRIQFVTGPNRGGCVARNVGLKMTSAPYVMFLDADDFLEGPILLSMIEALTSEKADFCIGDVVNDGEKRQASHRRRPDVGSWHSFIIDWMTGAFIPPCGVLWSTAYVRELGGWNEVLSLNQDGDIILRAAAAQARIVRAKSGHAVYWHHDSETRISNNMTSEKLDDNILVYIQLVDRLRESMLFDPTLQKALSQGLHSLERSACKKGFGEERKRIRDYRLANGWPRFEGNLMHRISCHILGLRGKERLSYGLHRLVRILFANRRKNNETRA